MFIKRGVRFRRNCTDFTSSLSACRDFEISIFFMVESEISGVSPTSPVVKGKLPFYFMHVASFHASKLLQSRK